MVPLQSRNVYVSELVHHGISVVVPAYNEHGNIRQLYAEVLDVVCSLGLPWELVFSDDGSTDGTWQVITELAEKDPRIAGVRLSRNFGHQRALLAGLRCARGAAIVSMDADLQHPPAAISGLVAEWRNGSKIVKTVRVDSPDTSMLKRLTSRCYYRLFAWLSGVPLQPGMADFRLLDRAVLDDILRFPEEGLFLRGIVEWVGYRSATVPYECRKRFTGSTKYSLKKMVRFAWEGISSFSIVPLRLAALVGFVASGISFLAVIYAIYVKVIAGHAVPGWASSVAIVAFLFGILFIILGLLGEYVGRILLEVRRRPRFLVSESLGIDESMAIKLRALE